MNLKKTPFYLLTVSLISLLIGFWIGYTAATSLTRSKLILQEAELEMIQTATARLLSNRTLNLTNLDNVSGETLDRMITESLLGNNSIMNPSNIVYLSIDSERVHAGLILDQFGQPYRFKRVVVTSGNLAVIAVAKTMSGVEGSLLGGTAGSTAGSNRTIDR